MAAGSVTTLHRSVPGKARMKDIFCIFRIFPVGLWALPPASHWSGLGHVLLLDQSRVKEVAHHGGCGAVVSVWICAP